MSSTTSTMRSSGKNYLAVIVLFMGATVFGLGSTGMFMTLHNPEGVIPLQVGCEATSMLLGFLVALGGMLDISIGNYIRNKVN